MLGYNKRVYKLSHLPSAHCALHHCRIVLLSRKQEHLVKDLAGEWPNQPAISIWEITDLDVEQMTFLFPPSFSLIVVPFSQNAKVT